MAGLIDFFSSDDMVSTGGAGYDTPETMVGTDTNSGFFTDLATTGGDFVTALMSGISSVPDYLSLGFTSSLGGDGGQFGTVPGADFEKLGSSEGIYADEQGRSVAATAAEAAGQKSAFDAIMEQVSKVKPDTWVTLAGQAMSGLYMGKVAEQKNAILQKQVDLAEQKQNTAATSAANVKVPWDKLKLPTGLIGAGAQK